MTMTLAMIRTVRFKVFTAVKMSMLVFWVVMQYGLVVRHGVTTQKTNTDTIETN
jgi:hypothetical protein